MADTDLFEWLKNRTKIHNDKIASNTPEVANWWYYKERFFGDSDFVDEGVEDGVWIKSHQCHDKHWRKVVMQFPELKGKDYTAIPYGKVRWHINEKVFYVIASVDLINNTKFRADILNEYNLNEDTVFYHRNKGLRNDVRGV